MPILIDREIRSLCVLPGHGPLKDALIEPFSESVSGQGKISWGVTSAGYDLRLGGEVWVFSNASGEPIDPKRFSDPEYQDRMFVKKRFFDGDKIVIPAHGYILGSSYEYLRIPEHMKGRCTGKSTLARCGVIVNTTPLEPGWEGHLTIEISNSAPCPAVIYCMEGCAQLEFETLAGVPEKTYRNKNSGKGGQYQAQSGVTPARVRE